MSKPPTGAAALEEKIRQRIRALGLRATSGRVAVAGHLLGAREPVTHADLCDRLGPSGFDRASLFRNLVDLARVGLISRTDLGDHVWRYFLEDLDQSPGAGAHHAAHPHFVCTRCGRALCLQDVQVVIKGGRLAPRSLKEKGTEVNLRGMCDECR